ncbi:MAG: hypothetical protein SYC29_16235 [Planctomycetota bacterium]|nr:hypothetical protein [Planctomycetota bacterium]
MNDDDGQAFSWQAHPLRERAGRAVAGVLVVAALAVVAGQLMQSAWWSMFTIAFLLLALNRFFFPSRFVIDAEGITASYPVRRLRLRWDELRRFAHGRSAAFLSTRARPSWWDGRRGMLVLFGAEREAVIDRIRAHLPEGVGSWAS